MIDIIVGNIGTGKSTYAKNNLKDKCLVWNADEIRKMFHPGVYIFDVEENLVIQSMKIAFIEEGLRLGFDLCFDDTNINREIRSELISIIREASEDVEIRCIDFGKGNDETLERRRKESRGVNPDLWNEVHKKFFDEYQEPQLDEGFKEIKTINI